MKMIFALICSYMFLTGIAHSQEWMAMQPTPPVVYTQPLPSQSYSTFPTIQYARPAIYQPVPIIVNRPVVVDQYGIFCKRTYIVNNPQIQWTYQLIFINP